VTQLETLVVYTADGCPHCRDLIKDFSRRKVRFVERNVSIDSEALVRLKELSWERRLPTVFDHERISVGFKGRSSTFDELGL
jgi:glutaredoxin